MDAIFTLPYSEYEVINILKKTLKTGYSFYIPTSRQQKGIDFIIHNDKSNMHLRVQVKSSRSYVDEPREKEGRKRLYRHNLWFNNFVDKYESGNADYYLLFGLYPAYDISKNIRSKESFWKSIVLCFSEKEMFDLLKNIKKTKKDRIDRFFGVSFDDPGRVFGSRGFKEGADLSRYLLDGRLAELRKDLDCIREDGCGK
jgi:hypothetical protein